MNLVKNYEERIDKLIEQTNRTVVFAFTSLRSDPSSWYYHLYYKHMLIKRKPWHGHVCNAWGVPIVYSTTGKTTVDKEIDIVKKIYKTDFDNFKMTVDMGSLEMFNADAYSREECVVLYTE